MDENFKTTTTKETLEKYTKDFIFTCLKNSLNNKVDTTSGEIKLTLNNGNIVYVRIYEVKED